MTDDVDTIARRLSSAARIDALTQMPNRRAVQEQIGLMMNRQSGALAEFAVLFINFDRFKQINDSLGNAVGDQVLVAMSSRMRAVLRQSNEGLRAPAGSGQMAADSGGQLLGKPLELCGDGPVELTTGDVLGKLGTVVDRLFDRARDVPFVLGPLPVRTSTSTRGGTAAASTVAT